MTPNPAAVEVFRSLGVDVSDPHDIRDLREDLEYLRDRRKNDAASKAALRTGLWGMVIALVTAALTTLGAILQSALGKH